MKCRRKINNIHKSSTNNFKVSLEDNQFDFYYSKYLCSFFNLENEKNCTEEILFNYDFFYEIKKIKRNVNISIDIKKSLLENIFLIIGIIPFLKFNSTIEYNINNKESNELFKFLFNYKNITDNKIIIDINDFETIKKSFNKSLNYIWDFPLKNKQVIDNIRFVINNYYEDNFKYVFEEILNENYNYYIQKNIKVFSDSDLKELISK